MPRRVNVTVHDRTDGLDIDVRPWVIKLKDNEEVEWVAHGQGIGDFQVLDKPDHDPLPPRLAPPSTLHRGPFLAEPGAPPEGVRKHYNIRIEINGEIHVIDPDYRVRP